MLVRSITSLAFRAFIAVCMIGCAITLGRTATLDYGAEGTPVQLVVGHPCCYAASWSVYIGHDKAFWKKYLPAGSTVDYEVAIAGPPVVNAMLAGKEQIGYLGDAPAIVVTTKEKIADIRLVATTALATDQCNILLVRPDAPAFASPNEAVRWLAGKQVAVPRGTCADRFAQTVFQQEKVAPAAILNQSIEVIASGFRAKKLDAAFIWEPNASQLIGQGLARRAASGGSYGMTDAAFVAMRGDLIDARPDVVRGWLNAELDAEQFMADPKNTDEVVSILHKYIPNFSPEALKAALYKKYPASEGGTDVRMVEPFAFPPDVHSLLTDATSFLYTIKGIDTPHLRDNAVDSGPADSVLSKRGLKAPVGKISAQD